jgi:hypothetical protein
MFRNVRSWFMKKIILLLVTISSWWLNSRQETRRACLPSGICRLVWNSR